MIGAFLCISVLPVLVAQQLAFPTAEGSGRYATGGRGGKVYEVTNLNNSGAGSIVDAVSQGNRTIVFRVSGTIELGSVILKPKSNTTIAGQTAPGDGICIKGRIQISASNIVIRYIRVRVDAGAANSSGDAIDISSGSNIIIDHVSASYARDEGISCQETSDKVTVQWCIISEALTFENHSYGSLIRGDFGDVKTYHHNLYAHNNNRLPRPGNYTMANVDTLGLFFDFRNNVVYNWKGTYPGYNADTGSISRYNIVGNVYVPGQESSVSGYAFKEDAYKAYGYFADNMYNGSVPADQWSLVTWGSKFTAGRMSEYKARSYQIPMEPVRTTSPEQAQQEVLESAGASFPKRDTIDRRIVSDVLNKTGHSIDSVVNQPEGGWPSLTSVPAPADTDHDGMPDTWETSHGLNPNDSSDGSQPTLGSYYTNLEKYLNALVGENVTSVITPTAAPESFLLTQNYPNPFNPVTTIGFTLPSTIYTTLKVFDMLGKEVDTVVDAEMNAGTHEVLFNGSRFASGVYFYKLQSGNFSAIRKLVLMK
ncbi:MAG: T9SS type A sorting domain-containing protein [Bacteroidota bacterium]